MAVSRAVEVDIEKHTTGQFERNNWYSQKSRVTLKEGMVEFGSIIRISLEDLKQVVAILDEPNKKLIDAWKPHPNQLYGNAE